MTEPLCIYSAAKDGLATDWCLAREFRGTHLLIEANAVEPRECINQRDLDLWDDAQIGPLDVAHKLGHEMTWTRQYRRARLT